MAISDWIERLGRVVFEAPFQSGHMMNEAPELAEVRLAVLDEIKAKSHRVAGRDVFPYNVVRIRLRGIPQGKTALFTSGFFSQFLEKELRGGLAAANFRFPEDFHIEIETTPELPGPKERWLSIEPQSKEQPAPVIHTKKSARLVVEKGSANEPSILLQKARTNLGRTVDVYRSDGPSRKNDLAFTGENDVNSTVSREHAHILYDKKSGEYRLFNDRWYASGTCGLWIIRDGLSQEVHRNARGVRLRSGDEIHLGRAVVRFWLK